MGGSQTCPECHGSGQVTQMGGRMKFNIQCPRCGGSGKVQHLCPTCHGEGVLTKTETIDFRIKPGTRDGQRIRLAGKETRAQWRILGRSLSGHSNRLPPGFTLGRRHPGDEPVTISEAAWARGQVPTIDGRAAQIPPGTPIWPAPAHERGVPSATREGVRRPDCDHREPNYRSSKSRICCPPRAGTAQPTIRGKSCSPKCEPDEGRVRVSGAAIRVGSEQG